MKRTAAGSRKSADPIRSRCKLIKDAIEGAEDCTDRVKEMLCSTIPVTVGALKANRHPFNEKFVTMIGEVLQAEYTRLKKDVELLEAGFAELTPAKTTREQTAAETSADAKAKAEDEKTAKAAVAAAGAALKELTAAVKEAEKARKAGDADLEVVEGKKAQLVSAQSVSLASLMDGSATDDDKMQKAKVVLEVGKSFSFDASLLSTAEPVLQKSVAERGNFDVTCLDQLQGAFNAAIAGLDEQLAAGAPGKAERAGAVQQAEAAKQLGEATQAAAKETAQAAKEARAAADAASKAATESLSAFMPDLKKAGDSLDESKEDLKDFEEGPLASLNELKELKEGDFKEEVHTGSSYYESIDGMKLDRETIDACRTAVAGTGDGRVSVDDAKKVFATVADGGKVTQCERWTVRYCLQEFMWTEPAQAWIVEALKNVNQTGQSPAKKAKTSASNYYEVIDGFKCDRAIIDACREAVAGEGDGRVSAADAQKVWEKAADGNQVTNSERWTVRYCLGAFTWTTPAHDWIFDQLHQAA